MLGSSVLSVGQRNDPQQTLRISLLELLQSISSDDNSVVHQCRSSWCSLGNQTIEVIDGLGKPTLVLNGVIEEEERDDVL